MIPQNFIPRILSTDNVFFTRHEEGNGIRLKSCNLIKDPFQGWCDTADIFILGLSCYDQFMYRHYLTSNEIPLANRTDMLFLNSGVDRFALVLSP
jgi:hypothetical protein